MFTYNHDTGEWIPKTEAVEKPSLDNIERRQREIDAGHKPTK